jgi:outer membrane receptor protein involved in Fe transport
MTIRQKAALIAGVSLNVIAACAAGMAAAADAPASADAAIATRTATDADSGAANTVQEVVVTSERRSESIQKVPMTVQAFTGDTLSKLNVETLDDLLRYTPNVTYGNNGPGQGAIFMRGLSSGFRGNQSSATVSDFPNVAIYLDEQSMQFPARNLDIYMLDMERVEVLEGPQGALFGGGAEAGALRYITKKPNLSAREGSFEVEGGATIGGSLNYKSNLVVNLPIVDDKFAVRAAVYYERQGGYIDNVPSTFTRSNADPGNNAYFNITPVGGICRTIDGGNGLPAYTGFPFSTAHPSNCTLGGTGQANNFNMAQKNQNPVTYYGGRVSGLYQIDNDWDVLITESYGNLDAEGLSVEYPIGSDFQPLKPLQVTAFAPSWERDHYWNTAWTVNGKLGDLKLIYTGGWTDRHLDQQMDYTNYSRSTGGIEYECTGPDTAYTAPGITKNQCYSPVAYWDDTVRTTHLSNEVRLTSPDDWRLRFVTGLYQENFRVYDDMNFNYKTIPSCNVPANLALATAPGNTSFVCLGNIGPLPGTTANDPRIRGNLTGFGEDTQRGYDQVAAFGSVDYDIIPKVLTVTLGTRWYQYKEFEVGSQYNMSGACVDVATCVGPATTVNINAEDYNSKYTGFKSRAGLTWHPDDNTTIYYLYSQGFRPGGFNRSNSKKVLNLVHGADPQFLEPGSYAPDTLTNNEIGYKTTLLDNTLQLNLSAYYMDWKNVQFFLFAPTFGINTTFGINGPSYNVKGVEAQFAWRATPGLTIQGSGSYNDDTVTKAPCLIDNIDSSGYPAGKVAKGQCIANAFSKSLGTTIPFTNPFGIDGDVPAFSPKFQGNIRARYEWTIGDFNAHWTIGANYVGQMFNQPASYTSGAPVLVPTTTYLRYNQPSYYMIDASVGISKDNWYAELYGTNLNDSHASTFTSSAQFIKSEVPLRPTVIMLKFGQHF